MTWVYVEFSSPIDDYVEVELISISNRYSPLHAGGAVGRAQVPGLSFTTVGSYLKKDMTQACIFGTSFAQVVVYFYNDGGDLYLLYKLTDAMITSVQDSGGKISATVNFAHYTAKYEGGSYGG
jgi:type VI protein secretion system component Hcp